MTASLRCVFVLLLASIALFAGQLSAQRSSAPTQTPGVAVTGELKRWHRITVTVDSPSTSETANPNPFLDLRMDVTFTHVSSGRVYRVPGYFAADGDAANTSATSGNKWRAHLAPDQVGPWTYKISFRQGPNVAGADSPAAGTVVTPFDGRTGSLTVSETDKTGNDFRAEGMLSYVGRHHLQFAGNKAYFLKVGSDSPENLLAYDDFDNTPNYTWPGPGGQPSGGFRHNYAAHLQDWRPGDATWKNDKGKGLLGAENYLASKGMNWQSFITYTTHGDDRNVSMYVDDEDRTRIDVSKVAQWEIVLSHMDTIGIGQEFKTYEVEGDWDHDGGEMGPERRLYFRELIARFGHHLALVWNTGEENNNTRAQRVAMADYLFNTDPYHHLIVIHNGSIERLYFPLLGKQSHYTGASLQVSFYEAFDVVRLLRLASEAAGTPWVITLDETRPGASGRAAGQPDATPPDELDPEHNEARKGALWACLMAGCAGSQTYMGYGFPQGGDLAFSSFRPWSGWWDQMRYAHDFFAVNKIPFWDMTSHNEMVLTGWALAGAGQMIVYLPDGACGGGRGGGAMGGAAFAPPFPGGGLGGRNGGRGGDAAAGLAGRAAAPGTAPVGSATTAPSTGTAASPDSPCPVVNDGGISGVGGGLGTAREPGRHGGGVMLRPAQAPASPSICRVSRLVPMRSAGSIPARVARCRPDRWRRSRVARRMPWPWAFCRQFHGRIGSP